MVPDVLTGSVCSGYGGLDLAIELAIPAARLAWVAEYEPPTAKVPNPVQGGARILSHRFPDIPNLGDITAVAWDTTARVKIIGGGTPCQDVSHAGARKGMRDGTRSGIWSSMVEAITHHRPTLVVWENVLGALSAGADSNVEPCPVCVGDERESHLRALGRVLGDLAEIGYDAVWQVVSASSVGAPHRRERVFVLAWPHADPDGVGPVRSRSARGRRTRPEDDSLNAPDALRSGLAADGTSNSEPELAAARSDRVDPDADAEGDRRDERRPEPAGILGGPDAPERGNAHGRVELVDQGCGCTSWRQYATVIHRWEEVTGRVAPTPTSASAKGNQQLSALAVEWLMGLPEGWVTDPAIWDGLSKSAARNAQLKALGNGVVPQQGAAAIGWLLRFAPEWVRADLGLAA